MKKILILWVTGFFLCLNFSCPLQAQVAPDSKLATAIAEIKMIDNHAHPLRALKEGDRDTEWGVLSYHATEANDPGSEMPMLPLRLRAGSPEYIKVWQTLYGLTPDNVTKERIHEAFLVKQKTMREKADNYPVSVLDKAGIETMLANRVVMDGSLAAPRFRWVPYTDALMYPLSNHETKEARPDLTNSYLSLERLLRNHLADAGLSQVPRTLEEYLSKVVTPTLERQKRGGAVAIKFVTAYLRTLDISNPQEKQMKRVYSRSVSGGQPTVREYKSLQDYLFRYISREAGRMNLPVHIHTGFGIGGYFNVAGSNPLLLDSVFNDPALRKTNFVILHGGWPFAKQTAAMLLKPNVYADFSGIAFLLYPRETGDILRSWLEIAPDKVLFGTDGFEVDPKISMVNWEELTWMGVQGARQALTMALADMVSNNEITQEDALGIARKVLRENAVNLYKLDSK